MTARWSIATSLLFIVALAGALLLAEKASALIASTHSASQVKSFCNQKGGTYSSNGAGGYGCQWSGGSISCDKSAKCTCQQKKCPAVVRGIYGSRRPPNSGGTASAAGGTAKNEKPPIRSVNQPVGLQHSGGHSGGSKH